MRPLRCYKKFEEKTAFVLISQERSLAVDAPSSVENIILMYKMCRTQFVLALVGLFVGLTNSWDIALTVGDRIEFYTNATKTAAVNFDSQKLTALAYDEVHNMLLYVDKQSDHDVICGYNISTVENRCYIKRNGNIQGLAFDPITQVLFFTDTKERSINRLSLEHGSMSTAAYGDLLIKMDDGIPTDIAVDSCKGYVYWINTNLTTSSIERARFNGSEREVVVKASNKLDLHSLAIGQQTQKMYWIMTVSSTESNIYRADLNGKNMENLINVTFTSPQLTSSFTHPNSLTVSKEFLIMVDWDSSSVKYVRKFTKPTIRTLESKHKFILSVKTKSFVGIAANYKISEQFHGINDCPALQSLVPNSSLNIARESEDLFCVHGVKVDGQSLCKCTPGYTGERCEVNVCENYCFRGNCSFNEEELPECRCDTGYTGDRCEVDVCHAYCLNNGTCSVNEEGDPVCQCMDDYADDRCDVPVNLFGGKGDGVDQFNESDCNCTSGQEDSRADRKKTISFAPVHFLAERNLTLADLLANWRKPVATISVVVDIKPN